MTKQKGSLPISSSRNLCVLCASAVDSFLLSISTLEAQRTQRLRREYIETLLAEGIYSEFSS